MKKNEIIELICIKLQSLTKLNFQINLGYVLKEFYVYKGLTYEMPSASGGDDKNDGWVEEEKKFYQIYAPAQIRSSFAKDIKDKFEEDLSGLLEKLSEGKWNGDINYYIFIVNTFDDHLPKDPDRFFEKTVVKLQEKSGYRFEYEVINLQYIKRMLREVKDIQVLENMLGSINLTMDIPIGTITDKAMYDFLTNLGNQIMTSTYADNKSKNYIRISNENKISINKLDSKKEEINRIIENLYIVENAVSMLHQNIDTSDLFDKIKGYVINLYQLLSADFQGQELLEEMYKGISKLSSHNLLVEVPSKYLIIYIFDHCDIFEKEEEKEC